VTLNIQGGMEVTLPSLRSLRVNFYEEWKYGNQFFLRIFPFANVNGEGTMKMVQLKELVISYACHCKSSMLLRLLSLFPKLEILRHLRPVRRSWCKLPPPFILCEHRASTGDIFKGSGREVPRYPNRLLYHALTLPGNVYPFFAYD